jgi:hypothetical protein
MEDFYWSTEWDGKNRRLFWQVCKHCSKRFGAPKHIIAYGRGMYCSKACDGSSKKNRLACVCPVCQIGFERQMSHTKKSKSGLFFCSRKCKEFAQSLEGNCQEIRPDHFGVGLGRHDYRARAIKRYGPKCMECGYSQDGLLLDVHHKDRNRDNNVVENLEVLCVWCHAFRTRKRPKHAWNGSLG